MRLFILFILIQLAVTSCAPSGQSDLTANNTSSDPLDWEALSNLIVQQAQPQAGEQVVLLAQPGRFEPLVESLKEKIDATGADLLGIFSSTDQQPTNWISDFTKGAERLDSAALQTYLQVVDLGIMMPGPTPQNLIYHLIQENLKAERGRTIHFHWSGAYDMNGQPLEITPTIDQHYQTAILETNYPTLRQQQRIFEQAMREQPITVTTPAGTQISFLIGDRPVTKQDGYASAQDMEDSQNLIDREIELPAGAVRVAPIEETVEGIIAFPDGTWNGEAVKGLKLVFQQGKVVDMQADQGLEAVQQEMEAAGPAGTSFREFALGFNPLLVIPEQDPFIPYYGYGAGVVRLSLGDNTELGGQVTGGYVRWNFFPDATVYVGDEVWVSDGKLVSTH